MHTYKYIYIYIYIMYIFAFCIYIAKVRILLPNHVVLLVSFSQKYWTNLVC